MNGSAVVPQEATSHLPDHPYKPGERSSEVGLLSKSHAWWNISLVLLELWVLLRFKCQLRRAAAVPCCSTGQAGDVPASPRSNACSSSSGLQLPRQGLSAAVCDRASRVPLQLCCQSGPRCRAATAVWQGPAALPAHQQSRRPARSRPPPPTNGSAGLLRGVMPQAPRPISRMELLQIRMAW